MSAEKWQPVWFLRDSESSSTRPEIKRVVYDQSNQVKAGRHRSTLTADRIVIWQKRYGFPADVEVRIPLRNERANASPEGYITISDGCLKAGFRIPPSEESLEILKFCGVPLIQFSFSGLTRIMGIISFFREHGSKLTVSIFRDLCEVYTGPGGRIGVRSNKRWMSFEEKADHRHGGTLFGYIKNEWELPEAWTSLPGRCDRLTGKEEDFSSILGYTDAQSLAKDIFCISSFVEEKRLMLQGLSFYPELSCPLPSVRGRKRKLVFSTAADVTVKGGGTETTPLPLHRKVDAGSGDLMGTNRPFIEGAKEVLVALSALPLSGVGNRVSTSPTSSKIHISSSLQPCVSKVEELCGITQTWNDHYVALKDIFMSLKEELNDTQSILSVVNANREKDVFLLERSRADLTNARAEIEKLKEETLSLRAKVDECKAERQNSLELLGVAEKEIVRQDTEMKTMRYEVTRLLSQQSDIEGIRVAAVADYKDSVAFLEERSRFIEEARAQIMTSEVDQLLEEECEVAFLKGFGKGLRLVQRKLGCSTACLKVGEISEDDYSDVDIEG